MATNTNKLPFLLAAGAVGGAVGYLFFTKSGQSMVDRLSQGRVNVSGNVADKVENGRQFVERRGKELADTVRGVVDHAKDAVEAGKHAYEQNGMRYRGELRQLGQRNTDAIANIHRAVDNMGRTFQTLQETVLDPFCEIGAMIRGIESGVQRFVELSKPAASLSEIETSADEELPPYYLGERIVR
jgi:hypothetical protein